MEEWILKHKSSELLCGLDGGGSITKVVVCNLNGKILYSFKTESINHYGAGTQAVRKTFELIAAKLLSKFGCLPEIFFVGNSAFDDRIEDARVKELTGEVFQASKVVLHSDVFVALMGFTMGKSGAVLISGTGSMACGIDVNGVYHTAGGWGQTLGDEGSAYSIGLKGIKAALRAHDGLIKPTELTSRLMHFYHLKKMSDLIDIIYNPKIKKSVIADFAVEVAEAARTQDKHAENILKNQTDWLMKLALVITKKCKTKNLGYYGSVLTKNETVRNRLAKKLAKVSINFQIPIFKPEIGALAGAFYEQGYEITDTIKNNFRKYKG